MSTLEEVVAAARRLAPEERRELIRLLRVETPDQSVEVAKKDRRAAREKFLALGGTGHSACTEVAADKYKHYGDVSGDEE